MDPIELGIGVLFGVSSQTLMGHLGYGKADLDTVVDLVVRKRLDVSASISGLLPLEDVAAGVEQLRTKQGDPVRLVVTP
jgi:threonine dehydrogenase-like Zn-dependent dehydrogenase